MAADTISITLAHHLHRDGADLLPGTVIDVPLQEARQLISSGYVAGADPSDPNSVARALGPTPASVRAAAGGKAPAEPARAE
ncbi:hypothetical protein LN042_18995 [Kitasatospora sp. RB6PN24]|uniref:hypothetical protein n=1 Tax=Kitasatospora humi TaxID=2893891 RepID=UPI001E3452B2|nr:hypothetical protein [Kitasatospora humi]MCC9309144.1 hypothetical protein [Kitasatospora humi]